MLADASIELDLRGLHCPMPVLRTRKALRGLTPGSVLTVLSSDPLAVVDIPHFVREAGHHLLEQTSSGGIATFRILKQS